MVLPIFGQVWAGLTRGIEEIRAKWAQLVQLASAADDVVCEARDLNLTFGIFGPTARTQTGNVHRLGEEQ